MQCVIPCEVDATAGGGSHVEPWNCCGLPVAGPRRFVVLSNDERCDALSPTTWVFWQRNGHALYGDGVPTYMSDLR